MPATTRTTRAAWIDAGLAALASGGPDAVRVDVLAKTLGVTRGGFYHQFSDRQAILDAMLDAWEARSIDDVLDEVKREGGSARRKAIRAGLLTLSDELMPIDLAVRDWARRDEATAARLRRVDNRRMDYLRSLVAEIRTDPGEVEAIALLLFSLLIGNRFIAADHPGGNRRDVLERAADLLLG